MCARACVCSSPIPGRQWELHGSLGQPLATAGAPMVWMSWRTRCSAQAWSLCHPRGRAPPRALPGPPHPPRGKATSLSLTLLPHQLQREVTHWWGFCYNKPAPGPNIVQCPQMPPRFPQLPCLATGLIINALKMSPKSDTIERTSLSLSLLCLSVPTSATPTRPRVLQGEGWVPFPLDLWSLRRSLHRATWGKCLHEQAVAALSGAL